MTVVTIHEAKTNLSRLLAQVEAGGEVIIARGSKPIAKLSALTPVKRRRPGLLAHLGPVPEGVFDPMTDAEIEELFGTSEF